MALGTLDKLDEVMNCKEKMAINDFRSVYVQVKNVNAILYSI